MAISLKFLLLLLVYILICDGNLVLITGDNTTSLNGWNIYSPSMDNYGTSNINTQQYCPFGNDPSGNNPCVYIGLYAMISKQFSTLNYENIILQYDALIGIQDDFSSDRDNAYFAYSCSDDLIQFGRHYSKSESEINYAETISLPSTCDNSDNVKLYYTVYSTGIEERLYVSDIRLYGTYNANVKKQYDSQTLLFYDDMSDLSNWDALSNVVTSSINDVTCFIPPCMKMAAVANVDNEAVSNYINVTGYKNIKLYYDLNWGHINNWDNGDTFEIGYECNDNSNFYDIGIYEYNNVPYGYMPSQMFQFPLQCGNTGQNINFISVYFIGFPSGNGFDMYIDNIRIFGDLIDSNSPTQTPTNMPTINPTKTPTQYPTASPSLNPSNNPSMSPTKSPSNSPSMLPTNDPSGTPSESPTNIPSRIPSNTPTTTPTLTPSESPTISPSASPTQSPTQTQSPSNNPSQYPSQNPSEYPSKAPSLSPSNSPTQSLTESPTQSPTVIVAAISQSDDKFVSISKRTIIIVIISGGILLTYCILCLALLFILFYRKRKYDNTAAKLSEPKEQYNIEATNDNIIASQSPSSGALTTTITPGGLSTEYKINAMKNISIYTDNKLKNTASNHDIGEYVHNEAYTTPDGLLNEPDNIMTTNGMYYDQHNNNSNNNSTDYMDNGESLMDNGGIVTMGGPILTVNDQIQLVQMKEDYDNKSMINNIKNKSIRDQSNVNSFGNDLAKMSTDALQNDIINEMNNDSHI